MLSADQVRHVQAAQQALLALDATGDPDGWAEPAFGPLRELFGTDHVYYVAPPLLPDHPTGPPSTLPPPTLLEQGPCAERLVVLCPSGGEVFAEGIVQRFDGFEDGFTQFCDPYATLLHRAVRELGPKAVHDGFAYDPAQRRTSVIFQEVYGPLRIERQMALSVPLPQGEAMIIAGFRQDRMPDYGGGLQAALGLLLPAFEAALHLRRRAAEAGRRTVAGLEATGQAVMLFAPCGTEQHRTRALERLYDAEPDRDWLAAAVQRLAVDLLQGDGTARRDVALSGGTYALRGGLDASVLGSPGALVAVERTSVLPPPGHLRARFSLTPRETEVAGLMARGFADKEVAESLFISPSTARRHAERVLKKVGVSSRAGLAYALLQL